jgi:Peptidase family M23
VSLRGRVVAAAALGVVTAFACAGLALADDVPVPTITDTATTVTTDTTAATTTVDTTTTAATTTATTPKAAPATTTARHPATPAPAGPPCVGAGPLLILLPHHRLRSVGAVSARVPAGAGATALTYPDSGAVLRAAAERVDVSGCAGTNATATSSLRRLSLFDGAIRVRELKATLVPATKGWRLRSTFKGLVVGGVLVTFKQRKTVPVGDWGILKREGRHTLRTAPNTTHVGLGWWQSGLSLQLTAPHGGLPTGTRLMIGYVAADYAYAPRKHGPTGRPLTATPPLEAGPYTFPVAGPASYIDTYGGPRGDVPGGWHHGDDIFASLGEPVVAVANGKVFRVGWERLGGWRLWLRDKQGNRFYYAHLSGYTKLARNGMHVRAGQQLGFVGNTGDAFTTPRHLHFEIHPKRFRKLGYNGAVDPTTYLQSWKRVTHVAIMKPAPLPPGASRHGDGAVSDYRELLVVRGIRRPPSKLAAFTSALHRPLPVSAAGGVASGSSTYSVAAALGAGLVSLLVVSGFAFRRRRRSVG